MPAILPDYEYDIFISYRQNDNKRDGWVTQFVDALKGELEATLKNPVSIYFDINPHDGLLEIHQVGASLEKKLKCLVFIPIISQTYCDTECFAWQHEFLPFIKMATEDELGMNIPLLSGNVGSRVLPVKIHDLDPEDQQALENELGGPMRAIDFIYKEAGVNRPLKTTDDRNLNIEKTDYHNQVNKVANALKELGTSLVKSTSVKNIEPLEDSFTSRTSKPSKIENSQIPLKLIFSALFILVVIASAYSIYTNYHNRNIELKQLDKSIAVLPFRNDSNDPANIYFCNGLMEDIINQLSQIPDVRVPSATSMLYYRDNPKPYEEIIEELNVAYLLEASVRKTSGKAIMNITLIDAEQNQQLWSERMEMDLTVKDLFDVQFEIANAVANKMRIAFIDTKSTIPTSNYEAYDKFLRARDLLKIWDLPTDREAINLLHESIELDSNFIDAYSTLGQAYGARAELSFGGGWVDSAYVYASLAYKINNRDAGALNALGYANVLAGKPREGLELYLEAYEINPNAAYNYAGWCFYQLGEFDRAGIWANQNIQSDPKNSIYYVDMGNATNSLGLFDYTIYYSRKALEINADHIFVYDNLMDMEIYRGNYTIALEHLQRVINVTNFPKDKARKGIIYYKLGNLDKAKQYLNIEIGDRYIVESDDENSRLERFKLLQQRAMVNIKSGDKRLGRMEVEDLNAAIDKNLSSFRPEKYLLLAAGYATLGNITKSIVYLNKVLDMGYNDYYEIINNSLLDPLHDNAEYRSIISTVKARNDKMRENILQEDFLSH